MLYATALTSHEAHKWVTELASPSKAIRIANSACTPNLSHSVWHCTYFTTGHEGPLELGPTSVDDETRFRHVRTVPSSLRTVIIKYIPNSGLYRPS